MKTTLTPVCTITPRDLRDKFAGYLNTLPLHQEAGRDPAFCQEERDALFTLLDHVEASLPEYRIVNEIHPRRMMIYALFCFYMKVIPHEINANPRIFIDVVGWL